MSSGGARPGAGRKRKLGKKVQFPVTVTPDIRSKARELKERGVDLNEEITKLIERL